jgi:molybdate transport system substrate-binding protein
MKAAIKILTPKLRRVPHICPGLADVGLARSASAFFVSLLSSRPERSEADGPALFRLSFLQPLALALLLCFTPHLFAQQSMRLAAAADLQPVLPPILDQFEKQTGVHVLASYQSSATLATQIIDGAPFDLFMAADLGFPQHVIDAGKAEQDHPLTYARGTLVLWTRNDSGVATLSLNALRGPAIQSIAIANPEHAPYGRAAQATLDHLGLTASVQPRLRIAENIAQAAQYADSGNAQVGFISLTSALTPRLSADGHFIRVPAEDYPPILQGAIVIRGSANADAAHRFLTFLQRPEIARELATSGLIPFPRP